MWRVFGGIMLRHAGLATAALKGDLDRLYVERLLAMVRDSSLDAVVILAQEHAYDDHGKAIPGAGRFFVPNNYVLDLARKHQEFLPAVSIHPGRPDALEELERCLAAGAVMMKCLPNCQNINCNDRRFKPFWARMAEAGLPLLAHTGGEHTLPVIRSEYADPRILTLPLECGVNVIAAHCGTKSGLFDRQYFHTFADMTRRYGNLYGDNSAFTVPIRSRHVSSCVRAPLVERLIHGSDFPVPVHGVFSWLRGRVDWKTFRHWQRQNNILERDYQLKRAMGFPPETFTRIWDLLRLTSAQNVATAAES
jgi:predicted TIM-barrel fold metal-dependent hydrolase